MATRQRRGTPRSTQRYYASEYVEGSAVRKLDEYYRSEGRSNLARVPERTPYQRPYREVEKHQRVKENPVVQTNWDLFSLLFMVVAISITMYICVSYLRVQHDVITMNKTIASLESQIMELKNENDAAYSKVDTSVDLAYIYKVATEELGMVHPVENQVFSFNNQRSSYVRQYGDIPEAKE